MDLLYSRPRLKIPRLCVFKSNRKNKNEKKIEKLIFILILIVLSMICLIKAVEPIFNELCKDKAKSIATIICNSKTTECMQGYNYSDFIIIHKDDKNNVVMLESNMFNINSVTSDIAQKIQEQINNTEDSNISISLGSFTGISLLSGKGPRIPIEISTIGNISTNFKSEFIEKGINQTLHRLYLEIECEISILTPFNTINEKIKNEFLITENIIVGNIPDAYYNIKGVTANDALEVVE